MIFGISIFFRKNEFFYISTHTCSLNGLLLVVPAVPLQNWELLIQ